MGFKSPPRREGPGNPSCGCWRATEHYGAGRKVACRPPRPHPQTWALHPEGSGLGWTDMRGSRWNTVPHASNMRCPQMWE